MLRPRRLAGRFWRGSLAVRMLVSVLILSALFAVLASGLQLWAEYRRQQAQIEQELDEIARTSLGSMAQALWHLDMQQNQIYLQGLHRLPNISALRLYFVPDQLVAQVGTLPQGRSVIRRSMPILYHDEAQNLPIPVGRLDVYVTLDGVYRQLWQQFAIILATQALQAFAISLCILLIFRQLVSRPLSFMAAYAKHMDLQHLDAPLVIPRRPPSGAGDELDVLALAINTMRASIREDVTELNRVQSALRENRALLQSILDNSAALIFVKDRDGRYLLVNRRFEEVHRRNVEAIAGFTDHELFPAALADQYRASDRKVLQQRKSLQFEITIPLGDDMRTFFAVKYPLFDHRGEPYAVCGIASDVTEIRQAEAERAARMVAEANNQAKSEFLSQMSHELRTPLNAVLGYAQLLKHEAGLTPRMDSGLDIIRQSGQHLLMLINDLLDLAKIEAGKLELCPEPTRLQDCLTVVADIIRVRVEQKSLQFELALADDLPGTVMVDEKRLHQILFNLLGNATKFTDHGQVRLQVSVLRREVDRVRLRFEVVDSGVGMAADQLTEIFLPFHQVGDARWRAAGTGLGLAISRQLVELMGSTIEVSSQPGAGSRFWFELELPLTDLPAEVPRSVRRVRGYRGVRRKILVVDDSAENRAMLIDWLAMLGFEPIQAQNGRQALDWLAGQAADLVVMDLVMPEMDGLEAMRQLRRMPGLATLPVIAFSANASERDRAASLAAGANAFLAKPIDETCFVELLEQLLALEWIQAEQAVAESPGGPARTLVAPPAAEIAELHRLALAGNMRPIRLWAEHIVTLDESYRPFAEQLLRLAQSFQSKAILELAERHLDPAAKL